MPDYKEMYLIMVRVVVANRGTSSKSARFFRHRRRFADFPDDPPASRLLAPPP